jgi:hypothetical protein
VGIFFLASGSMAQTQTSADDIKRTFETTLKGNQLPIRDFLGDLVIRYAWDGSSLQHGPERVFTPGIFRFKSIHLHESNGEVDQLTLDGERRTLVKSLKTDGFAVDEFKTSVSFEVDLHGAGPLSLNQIVSQLFYPDIGAMLLAIPQRIAVVAHFQPGHGRSTCRRSSCWIREGDVWRELEFSEGLKRGKVLSRGDGDNKHIVPGTGSFCLDIAQDGTVEDIWVMLPKDGMNEGFVNAFLKSRYAPSTYLGQPVGVLMNLNLLVTLKVIDLRH